MAALDRQFCPANEGAVNARIAAVAKRIFFMVSTSCRASSIGQGATESADKGSSNNRLIVI
jgi:hypothetical protein